MKKHISGIIVASFTCLAILFAALLVIPQNTHAAGFTKATKAQTQPVLTVSPSSLNLNKSCGYEANHGWICSVTLKNNAHASKSLSWTAVNNSYSSSTPGNGTLLPGAQTIVQVFISNLACPAKHSFAFAGPVNTVTVSWSCAGPNLTTSTTNIVTSDPSCTFVANEITPGWQCNVDLGINGNDQGGLNWSSSVSGKACYTTCRTKDLGITVTPSSGSLVAPSAIDHVNVFVPECVHEILNATINFKGPVNTVKVNYACTSSL